MKRRGLANLLGAAPLLVAALALPGSASAQYRPGYPSPYHGGYGYGQQGTTVDGFITADRGRCLVLRDHQRRTYYLSGDTDGLRPGDHVSLRERSLSRSSCGNDGPTLEVLDVRTVWTGGSHRSAYFDARRDGDFGRFLERSRDRGGWYSDRYSYMQRGGGPNGTSGRYGDRDRYEPNGPNGPNGRYAPPYGPNGQAQPQPQYDPNNQYDPNGPGQYDQNGQYNDDQRYDQNAPPDNGPYDRSGAAPQSISVDGTLDFNGSCPAVRDRGGVSYDLAGDLRSFHNGDRVHVTGVLAGSSSCGGTALEVQEIRRR
jgi:hypothetical protein